MRIKLSGAGKRYNREWIFRKADLDFNTPSSYAITGPNGSGKSTLLQCLGGMLQLSEGRLLYEKNNKPLDPEKVFREISFCAPYQEVMEEMTLLEFLNFHGRFKNFLPDFDLPRIIEAVGLKQAAQKQIRFYSSGMKQRVKLAQCFFSDTSLLLLDEPCSNLDAAGIELYHSLVRNYTNDRLVIVCSNDEVEFGFCTERINIVDHKEAG